MTRRRFGLAFLPAAGAAALLGLFQHVGNGSTGSAVEATGVV